LGDVHPLDGLRSVCARPQRRLQLRQVHLCLRREPLDRLPIHARRAAVGLDLRPGCSQRCGCKHLVNQREPLAAFDPVVQGRQHPLRPPRGFNPRPGSPGGCSLCTLLSHCTSGAALPRRGQSRLHLPALPSLERVLLPRPPMATLHTHHIGTMPALTPRRLAHAPQGPLLPLPCRPSIPPPTTPWARSITISSTSVCPPGLATWASPWICRLADTRTPKRVRHPAGCSFASGCSPPRL